MIKIIKKLSVMTFVVLIGFIFMINTNALTIKESTDPTDKLNTISEGSFVIGLTKFNSNSVVTARLAGNATIAYNEFHSSYVEVPVYVYQLKDWYEIDGSNNVTPVEDEGILEDLQKPAIYYVDGKEKMIELPFLNELEEKFEYVFKTNENKNVKAVINGDKISIPATTKSLKVIAKKDDIETTLSTFELKDAEFKSNFIIGTIAGAESANTFTVDNNDITVLGKDIKWVNHDGSLQNGRKAGNYIAVKITAPKEYDQAFLLENTTVSFNGKTPTKWGNVIFGIEDVYFTLWQKVELDNNGYTVTINWEKGNTQTFNIYLDEATTLEEAPKGKVSSSNSDYIVEGNTITLNGNLNFHLANSELLNGRSTGFYGSKIIFTAPEGDLYTEGYLKTKAKVTIDNRDPYNWETVATEAAEKTHFGYWPKFNENEKEHTVTIEWEPGNVQVFKIVLSEDIEFEDISGKYEVLTNNGTLRENDTANFTGNITWYEADKSVGRNVAGNRVGVKITAPEKINTEETKVKIGETTYNWVNIQDGNGSYFEWWPLISNANAQTLTAVITWAKGITQTFTINLNDITLEVNPEIGENIIKVGDGLVEKIVHKNDGTIEIASDVANEDGLITDEAVLSKLNEKLTGTSGYVNLDYNLTYDNEDVNASKVIIYRNNNVFKTLTSVEENSIKLEVAIAFKSLDGNWSLLTEEVEWKIEWFGGEIANLIGRTFFTTKTVITETE